MKIAIIGAGNVGCATACDLSSKGHHVTLIKSSQSMHNENFKYISAHDHRIKMIEPNGKAIEARIDLLTTNISQIKSAEIVFVMIQTTFHEDIIKRMIPHLQRDQIIVFNPGYLSTALMIDNNARKDVIIVEAESSFIDCRIHEKGKINVSFRNVRNPLGVFPNSRADETKRKLESLGFPFTYLSSVIEAALHNPNLIVHTVGAIMSIPRVEKTNGNYYMYHEVFTPSVWNILEKLDKEKMDILEKLGFSRLSYVEACKYRNTLDNSKSAIDVFFEYANDPNSVKGPTSVDARYISEDVPQGLVLLESLGGYLKVSTPVTTSLIEIASAALKRDMRKGGRTLEKLGVDSINRILLDSGYKNI